MVTPPELGQACESAVERTKGIFQRLFRTGLQWPGKPAPLWALFLVAMLGAFALSRMSGSSDQAPKRWNSVNEEAPSNLYNSLVNPPSPAACDPAFSQCDAAGPLPVVMDRKGAENRAPPSGNPGNVG